VIGIGVNVAVEESDFPAELQGLAGTLGRQPDELEPTLAELLAALERRLAQPTGDVLTDLRARDALRGRTVRWASGHGEGAGIDDGGGLVVRLPNGGTVVLESGEVHLLRPSPDR
jgi:BirA family biotin operon repressor/biotin-[acetyl-CoA-carboxylase] ligase